MRSFDQYELGLVLTRMKHFTPSEIHFYGRSYVEWCNMRVDTLRAYLQKDDKDGFFASLQDALAADPDWGMEFLETLFERVELPRDADWLMFEMRIVFTS